MVDSELFICIYYKVYKIVIYAYLMKNDIYEYMFHSDPWPLKYVNEIPNIFMIFLFTGKKYIFGLRSYFPAKAP